jgi:hypothetical protein
MTTTGALMNIFEKNEREKADADYASMRAWADNDNACVDVAIALEPELREYIERNVPTAKLTRKANLLTVVRSDGMILAVTVEDHRRFFIDYPNLDDARTKQHRLYGSRPDEREMTIAVVEWLNKP